MQRMILGLTLVIVPGLVAWAAFPSAVPGIEGYGAVQPFPEAAEQPRNNSKIVVDVTQGGPRDQINPAVDKLARFINIYARAGKVSTNVEIAVVLHGDATHVALNDEAYGREFGLETNPNLPLIRKLREHGVEFLVCGQAMTRKKLDTNQVAPDITLAVSGLTALVNKQQDGYAYLPLLK